MYYIQICLKCLYIVHQSVIPSYTTGKLWIHIGCQNWCMHHTLMLYQSTYDSCILGVLFVFIVWVYNVGNFLSLVLFVPFGLNEWLHPLTHISGWTQPSGLHLFGPDKPADPTRLIVPMSELPADLPIELFINVMKKG